ncbi:MAG: hypothetical protein HQM01_12660 [Magnetococcales bacterium]|nr:hypothetical protein [Magnetococcales bacterium]
MLTADADTQAIMNAVLQRHAALGIRQVDFDVMRHSGRDNGVYNEGPEFVRIFKDKYKFLLVIFDHHGSGCNQPEQTCQQDIQSRLDGISWSERSYSIVISPEGEAWLWKNQNSICSFFDIQESRLQELIIEYCNKKNHNESRIKLEHPKELFDYICYIILQKGHLLPREYKKIALQASLTDWQNSSSFNALVTQLLSWFPQP